MALNRCNFIFTGYNIRLLILNKYINSVSMNFAILFQSRVESFYDKAKTLMNRAESSSSVTYQEMLSLKLLIYELETYLDGVKYES